MCRNISKYAGGVLALALLSWTMAASAQFTASGPSTQFDITGVLQEATVNSGGQFAGGTLRVNGHKVVVPANTVVQYPANNTTWADVFNLAPLNNGQSGMAMADTPPPFTNWEVHVVGNRIGDTYIAGLITLVQEGMNSGAGFINYINYGTGDIFVGGTPGVANGARIQLNDPQITKSGDSCHGINVNGVLVNKGRCSKGQSPDQRFSCDQDNPTIRSVTGYPMGLPQYDPAFQDDPNFCPAANRPIVQGTYLTNFMMPAVANVVPGGPDPRLEAPLEVGDYINYSGTLIQDTSPLNTPTYVSVHTLIDNAAIYTAPGDTPAYVTIDDCEVGTGGTLLPGLLEATGRTVFEGFTTDPSRIVFLFAMDLDANGNEADRDWGSVAVDPGPPTGAAMGRWRVRTSAGKFLTLPGFGTYGAPPRNVRAVLAGDFIPFAQGDLGFANAAWTPLQSYVSPNGLVTGQYQSPVGTYIFPEQIAGQPVPAANFEVFAWLQNGGQVLANNAVAGPLSPLPNLAAPPALPAPLPGGPDVITISGVDHRTPRERLVITATSSLVDPLATSTNVKMTCSTMGGLDSNGNPADAINAPMTFVPAIPAFKGGNGLPPSPAVPNFFTTSIVGTGSNATSVTIQSNLSGTATIFEILPDGTLNPLWKLR